MLPLKQNTGFALLTKFIDARFVYHFIFSIFMIFPTFDFCCLFNMHFRESTFLIPSGGGTFRSIAETTNASILTVSSLLFCLLEPPTPAARVSQATKNNLLRVVCKIQMTSQP